MHTIVRHTNVRSHLFFSLRLGIVNDRLKRKEKMRHYEENILENMKMECQVFAIHFKCHSWFMET